MPTLIQYGHDYATAEAQAIINQSLVAVNAALAAEIERLQLLQKRNQAIRSDDIARRNDERTQLTDAVAHAQLRLDSVRLIFQAPGSNS